MWLKGSPSVSFFFPLHYAKASLNIRKQYHIKCILIRIFGTSKMVSMKNVRMHKIAFNKLLVLFWYTIAFIIDLKKK